MLLELLVQFSYNAKCEMCLLKRAGLLVTVAPVVYVGFCACWTIGEVAYRYRNSAFGGDPDSAFGGDPVVKEEMSKLYDRVETKKNSSGSLSELINKKERAALLRRKFKYELRREVKKMANELEAEAALNIWKQNWRRSMIANFQRRLK